jgi:hypothetical protein
VNAADVTVDDEMISPLVFFRMREHEASCKGGLTSTLTPLNCSDHILQCFDVPPELSM